MNKKLILILLVLYLSASTAYAQEKEDKFVLDYHEFGGNQSVEISLENFLNPAPEYYVNAPKFVNVKIDQATKLATITPKESNWTGRESVVFGVSPEIVKETARIEELKKEQVQVGGEGVKIINLTNEEVTKNLDPLIQQGFLHIVKDLPKSQVQIKTEWSGKDFQLNLNNEVKLNISFYKSGDEIKPKFGMEFALEEKNMTRAEYKEKDYETPLLFGVIILTSLIIVVYLVLSSNIGIETIKKKKVELYKSALNAAKDELKKGYLQKLGKATENRPIEDGYKNVLILVKNFLKDAYKVKTGDLNRLYPELRKKGVAQGTVNNIKSLLESLEEKEYSKKGITKPDLTKAIKKAQQIIQSY